MRKKLFAKKIILTITAVLFVALSAIVPLRGQAQAAEQPTQRVQINKLADYPKLNPGEIYTSKIPISNSGNQMIKYKITVEPYSVKDYAYDSRFDQQNDYTLLANWVALGHSSGVLEAGESVDVPFTIKVPTDVPAGGQYAAIAVAIDNDDQGGSIIAQNRVAMLIYATINGETNRTGSINSNNINGVYFNAPVTATSVVENTGNIHEDVTSTLEVFGLFDNKSVYSNVDKPDKHTVLPKTHRTNKVSWDDAPVIGLFKAKQVVTFMGQSSVREQVILICPLWLIILVAVLIVGLVTWIVLRIRERKKTNTKVSKE